MPPKPPSSSLLNDVNPFPTDTDRKIGEYNTKASKNVQTYTEYNATSHANSSAMPRSYPTLPTAEVMTLREPVALALTTVLTVVRWRQAEPHPVLAGTPTWYDDDAVDVLIRPDRELYGWIDAVIDDRPRRYALLAVAGYRVGLLVLRDLDTDVAVMRSCDRAGSPTSSWGSAPSRTPGPPRSSRSPAPARATCSPRHARTTTHAGATSTR